MDGQLWGRIGFGLAFGATLLPWSSWTLAPSASTGGGSGLVLGIFSGPGWIYLCLLCVSLVALPRTVAAIPLLLAAILAGFMLAEPATVREPFVGAQVTLGIGPLIGLAGCLLALATLERPKNPRRLRDESLV